MLHPSDSSDLSSDEGQPQAITEDAWTLDVADLSFGKKIGSGNFAKVIKGEYLGTPVAIKKVFEAEKDMQKYVRREVSLLKTLRHPNIVQFIGCCEKDGGVYIVTEFVPGGDLRTLLKRTNKHGMPKLTWRQRTAMAVDIAAALLYLTSQGFVHRDLKTRNLLVLENGRIKICDFGLARKLDGAEETKYMTICGTDEYMAPEVMLGDKYNEKADVYSFGMVCCELITHKDPPERQAHDGFRFHDEAFLKTVSPRCPRDFLRLTLECVRYRADERPGFRAILNKLKEILVALNQEQEMAKQAKAEEEKRKKDEEEKRRSDPPPRRGSASEPKRRSSNAKVVDLGVPQEERRSSNPPAPEKEKKKSKHPKEVAVAPTSPPEKKKTKKGKKK